MNMNKLRGSIAKYIKKVTGFQAYQLPQDLSQVYNTAYFTINEISDEFIGYPSIVFDSEAEQQIVSHNKVSTFSIQCVKMIEGSQLSTEESPSIILNKVLKADFFQEYSDFLLHEEKISIKSISKMINITTNNKPNYEYRSSVDIAFNYCYIESNQQNKINTANENQLNIESDN